MNDTKVRYAAFKIYSPKHDFPVETSCAPGEISNYFETTNLPWEISPAFFQADVLNKYRADTQNYELAEDYLVYRDDWDLKRYGIKEKGLIWTYVRYLQPLPYEEQLHWQSFNVWPETEDVIPFRIWRPALMILVN